MADELKARPLRHEPLAALEGDSHGETMRTGRSATDPLAVRAAIVRETIRGRRSVRAFTRQPIPHADLLELIEAGVHAPSASNAQNQRFLLLTDPDEIERLGRQRFVWPWPSAAKAHEREAGGLLARGTALILVFADAFENDRRPNGEYYIWQQMECQNAAASIQNILLLAAAKGIGACWVSASERMSYTRLVNRRSWSDVLRNYDIPRTCKIHGIVVLGHPKRAGDHGYPPGEAMHGATVWQATARRPVETYLIEAKSPTPSAVGRSRVRRALARSLSRCLQLQVRALQFTDQCLWRVDVNRRDR